MYDLCGMVRRLNHSVLLYVFAPQVGGLHNPDFWLHHNFRFPKSLFLSLSFHYLFSLLTESQQITLKPSWLQTIVADKLFILDIHLYRYLTYFLRVLIQCYQQSSSIIIYHISPFYFYYTTPLSLYKNKYFKTISK